MSANRLTMVVVIVLSLRAGAQAQTNSWIDGNGKWETSANWSLGVRPTNSHAVLITNAGNKTVTIDATTAGSFPSAMAISNLTVSALSGATNTLFLNNAGTNTPLTVFKALIINSNGSVVANHSVLGISTNHVSANEVNATNLVVGYTGGNAMLIITNGGAVHDNNAYMGVTSNSANNRVLVSGSGSVWSNGIDLKIGDFGSGNSVVISSGAVVYSLNSYLGFNSISSNNSVLVTDGGSVWSNHVVDIGLNGSGNSLVISNGGAVHTAGSYLGGSGSSNNTVVVTGSGSKWTLTNLPAVLFLGQDSAGNSLVINNGGAVNDRTAYVGSNGGGSNTARVVGFGSVWSNQEVKVGFFSAGNSLVISNDGLVVSSNLVVGAAGASNKVTIAQGGKISTTSALIGDSNNTANANMVIVTDTNSVWNSGLLSIGQLGSLNQLIVSNAAAVHVTGTISVGSQPFQQSNLVKLVDGGQLFVGQTAFVASTNSAQATILITGGITALSSNLIVASFVNSTGTVFITQSGRLTATNGVIGIGNNGTHTGGGGTGLMVVSNGTLQASTILLGSSTGGKGDLFLANGGIISCLGGTNCLMEINSLGTVVREGGDLQWDNGTLRCGVVAPGDYIVEGGQSAMENLYIGYENVGTMTMAGGVVTVSARLFIGHSGSPLATGAVWINGGEFTAANNITTIGDSGVGQMTISNGLVTLADVFVANSSNPGTLTVAGGMLNVYNTLTVGDCNAGHVGVVAIVGGNLYVTNAAHTATLDVRNSTLTLSSGLLKVDRLVMTNACGLFIRSGGTPIIESKLLSPGLDADGDGMLNGWEESHGLDPLNAADAGADNDGDGLSNLREHQLGTDPANPSSPLRITAIAREGNDVRITWTTVGGTTNRVQFTPGVAGGSYNNNFSDLSPQLIIDGTTVTSTNYVDPGGATNIPSRYYRIRVVP